MRTIFNESGRRTVKTRRTERAVASYFCVVLLLAALPACRKDRETDPKRCELTAVRGFAGEVLERFEYNQAGRLVKYTLDGLSYRLQYNDAGQLASVVESGRTPEQLAFEREITLQYRDNGRTVVVTKPVQFASRPYQYTIELDQKGQLLRYAGDEDGRGTTWRYEYDDAGNMVRSFHAQGLPEHLAYEQDSFDGKPSPYYGPESLRTFMQLIFGKAVSRHNPLVTRHYNRDGSAVEWTRTDVNAYNDRGYLVSQQGEVAGFGYAVSYLYTCR
jgi:YD repeat-containing protein